MAKFVRDIMTPRSKLIILEPDESIEKANELMRTRRINSILIRPPQGGSLWRIFTSTDMLLALSTGVDAKNISIAEFASIATYTAHPEWTIEKSLDQMVRNGIKHLLVLDNNELVGIISASDLMNNY